MPPLKAQFVLFAEESSVPALFAAFNGPGWILLIEIVWLLAIKCLVLWWIIHAMIEYRFFRYLVLGLFAFILLGLASMVAVVLLTPRRPVGGAAGGLPVVLAQEKPPKNEGENSLKDGRTPTTIHVTLPDEADLWVQGTKTRQTGRSRIFQTPPMEADQPYDYELRAGWVTGNRVVYRTRHAEVRAGGRTEVDFNKPDAADKP